MVKYADFYSRDIGLCFKQVSTLGSYFIPAGTYYPPPCPFLPFWELISISWNAPRMIIFTVWYCFPCIQFLWYFNLEAIVYDFYIFSSGRSICHTLGRGLPRRFWGWGLSNLTWIRRYLYYTCDRCRMCGCQSLGIWHITVPKSDFLHLLPRCCILTKLVQGYVCELFGRLFCHPPPVVAVESCWELVLFVVFLLGIEREIGYFVVEFLFKIVSKYYLDK